MLHDSNAALLSESCVGESWWPGSLQRKQQFLCGSIFVVPERMPFRYRSFTATESFHVEIGPEFLGAGTKHQIELRPAFGEEDRLVASVQERITIFGNNVNDILSSLDAAWSATKWRRPTPRTPAR